MNISHRKFFIQYQNLLSQIQTPKRIEWQSVLLIPFLLWIVKPASEEGFPGIAASLLGPAFAGTFEVRTEFAEDSLRTDIFFDWIPSAILRRLAWVLLSAILLLARDEISILTGYNSNSPKPSTFVVGSSTHLPPPVLLIWRETAAFDWRFCCKDCIQAKMWKNNESKTFRSRIVTLFSQYNWKEARGNKVICKIKHRK